MLHKEYASTSHNEQRPLVLRNTELLTIFVPAGNEIGYKVFEYTPNTDAKSTYLFTTRRGLMRRDLLFKYSHMGEEIAITNNLPAAVKNALNEKTIKTTLF